MPKPNCPYKNRCGGCLYLDIPPKEYIQKKINFVKTAFSHNNLSVELADYITIPFGLRRRVTFAFNKGIVGFNKQKSHEIIPMTHCPAIKKELSDLLPDLQNLTKALQKSGDVSLLLTAQGVDVHIKTKKETPNLNERMLLADFAVTTKNIVRLTFNNEPIVEKVPLPFLPDIFLQPSAEGEQLLVNQALASFQTEKKIVDLFCGAGTFTKPLTEKGFTAHGYDSAPDSIRALGPLGTKRDLFRNPLLAEELNAFDGIIMDPPRAGALAQTKEIAKSQVKKVVMISCNPITAARDSAILTQNGYKLVKITPIDQFIYTNHIEIICRFEKNTCN